MQTSTNTSDNTKRIAKNTIFLYFRMFIAMVVGLFTSRILLQALGVVDYGIYNVVGGFVAMFSMISGSLTAAISRFITFELGTGDIEKLTNVFSTSIVVQIGLSIIVLLIGETAGLWFLNNKMVIPDERMNAAFWCFQLALITFVINLMSTPYTSCIVSHEKMDAFAYISIYEMICKLLICYAVMHTPIDRLVYYAILLFLVGLSVRFVYTWYCKRHFKECTYKLQVNKTLLKEMFGFASWNFIGSAGWVLRGEGGNLLFNLFGGPTVNAANGIASALSNTVTGFVSNFMTAIRPQITKDYAAMKYRELNLLLSYGAKLSFYMMLLIGLPVILNAHFLLKLWLGIVPEHTETLVKLIILVALSDTISVPLVTAKNATGNIRNYQIVVGSVLLMTIPIAYIFLKLDAPVESIYLAYIITSFGCLSTRMFMLRGDIPEFSIKKFSIDVVLNVWSVAVLSAIVPYLVHLIFEEGWVHLIVTCSVSVISCIFVMFFIGLNKSEQARAISLIASKMKKQYG